MPVIHGRDGKFSSGGGASGVLAELLAKEHLGIASLVEQKRDRLDFHEVHVGSVKRALVAAHKSGGGKAADADAVADRMAKEHLGIASLKEAKRDSEDFHSVHVSSVKRALMGAHEAGKKGRVKKAMSCEHRTDMIVAGQAVFAAALSIVQKRQWSADQRSELAKRGCAMPDGSHPIENTGDLHDSIQSYGRSKKKMAVKKHITDRAKALGASAMLPDGWADEGVSKRADADGEEVDFTIRVPVSKRDGKIQVAYGWASVSVDGGEPVIDHQGDVIETTELRKALHEYMRGDRAAKVNHEGEPVGDVVEAIIIDAEIAKALGAPADKEGMFVGMHFPDPAVWARVESGELPEFSIHGTAVRVPIEVD